MESHEECKKSCEYGCGLPAKHYILTNWNSKNKKWCCSTHHTKCPETQAKKRRSNLKKYGVEYPSSLECTKEKRKQTNIKKFGTEHASQNQSIKEKTKRTNIEKYGGTAPVSSNLVQAKMQKTTLERHGVTHPLKSEKIKQKVRNTNIKKYGTPHPNQSLDIQEKRSKTRFENYFDNIQSRVDLLVTPLFKKSEYKGISAKYLWKCTQCEHEFRSSLDNGIIPRCKICFPNMRGESHAEKEINDFIESMGIRTLTKVRNLIPPLELDIWIPEKQIAVEYHGLYWHSEEHKSYRYHQEKYKKCNDKNIRLIQVFEDEWSDKKEIVKNRIRYSLGFSEKICGARECQIKEISAAQSRAFLETNHLQGSVNARVKLGAFFQEQLVAVMTFGSLRKSLGSTSKSNVFELLRFATTGAIPGIASRLFSYFKSNYQPLEVISYCDLRWGIGKVYEQMGFILSHETKPNYFYIIEGRREFRFKFRKSFLVKEGYDNNLTEKEIMHRRGIFRIHDAGNLVFKWKLGAK